MLLVLMSIEKSFVVYFPLKSKSICTMRTAKWATGIGGVILAAYNIVDFFRYESEIQQSGQHECVFLFDLKIILILETVGSTFYSFGPFALMCVTNFAIGFKFMKAKCRTNQHISTESTNRALAKSATRGTAMVVTVSVAFILLTAPTTVNATLNFQLARINPFYQVFMNSAQYLNHTINGVLYCIVGSRFRKELLKIFCRKERPETIATSHSLNCMNPTTTSRGGI